MWLCTWNRHNRSTWSQEIHILPVTDWSTSLDSGARSDQYYHKGLGIVNIPCNALRRSPWSRIPYIQLFGETTQLSDSLRPKLPYNQHDSMQRQMWLEIILWWGTRSHPTKRADTTWKGCWLTNVRWLQPRGWQANTTVQNRFYYFPKHGTDCLVLEETISDWNQRLWRLVRCYEARHGVPTWATI